MTTARWTCMVGAIGLGIGLLSGTQPIASAGATGAPPFDFTGHWTGVAQEENKPAVPLSADLTTGSTPRKFTGSVLVEDVPPAQCSIKGVQKPNEKVKMRVICPGAGVIKLHGTLAPDTRTVTGTFTRQGRRRRHTGTFTLSEQAG